MRITASTDFKHGRMQFEKDLSYTVPNDIGAYFVAQKWAMTASADAKCFTVQAHLLGADAEPAKREGDSLEIQDSTVHIKSEVK